MEIVLNGEKLDFTLEKEDNLQKIVESIEQWLKKSNMIITELLIGNNDLFHEPRNRWSSFPITEIEKITISALPVQEVRINNINTVKEYLTLLQEAIRNSDIKIMEQLKSGYGYMLESIHHLFNNFVVIQTKNEINAFLEFYASTDIFAINTMQEQEKMQILSTAENLFLKLNELLVVESDPVKALIQIRTTIIKSIAEIREVSIHLQTGKDKDAMDSIIHFSDLMQYLLCLFQKLIDTAQIDLSGKKIAGQPLETFYNELNRILTELVEAFTVKDYVLIGDLLEYEIAPRLENVIEFIEEFDNTRVQNDK